VKPSGSSPHQDLVNALTARCDWGFHTFLSISTLDVSPEKVRCMQDLYTFRAPHWFSEIETRQLWSDVLQFPESLFRTAKTFNKFETLMRQTASPALSSIFEEFMNNQMRSGILYCDSETGHARVAGHLLRFLVTSQKRRWAHKPEILRQMFDS